MVYQLRTVSEQCYVNLCATVNCQLSVSGGCGDSDKGRIMTLNIPSATWVRGAGPDTNQWQTLHS